MQRCKSLLKKIKPKTYKIEYNKLDDNAICYIMNDIIGKDQCYWKCDDCVCVNLI